MEYNIKNLQKQIRLSATENESLTVFISGTDGLSRARVIACHKTSPDALDDIIREFCEKETVKHLRVDVVMNKQKMSFPDAQKIISETKRSNYFRSGIAFDDNFTVSLLPEELQGNAILKPVAEHVVGLNSPGLHIDRKNLEGYICGKYNKVMSLNPERHDIILFETQGFFLENGEWLTLSTDNTDKGLRLIRENELCNVMTDVITGGTRFLLKEMGADGKFTYGYWPCYNKVIPGYNSVRHFSSIYALLESSQFLKDDTITDRAKAAIEWGLQNLGLRSGSALYIAERNRSGVSVKLGAQAMALLAISKYQEVSGSHYFLDTIYDLISGIKEKFIDAAGNTVHILDENLEVKRAFEIVYYDGEAVFGILRSYLLTNDNSQLLLAKMLFDRLIAKGYEKYHDHWLSYATNEILLHLEEKEYYEFGLKNAFGNLNFISKRDTAYPTMLELLMAAIKMVYRLQHSKFQPVIPLPEADVNRLVEVAHERALHEIKTGVFWPELAMFMKHPDRIVNSFYARHDRFRIRIDDQEHFLSGLINYVNWFHHSHDLVNL